MCRAATGAASSWRREIAVSIGDKINMTKGASMDEDVQFWFTRLDRGIERRHQECDRWTANEAFIDMRQWSDGGDGYRLGNADEPTINKIASYVRTYRAAICYKNPRAKMWPKSSAGWEPVIVPVLGSDGRPVIGPDGVPKTKKIIRYQMREKLLNEIISGPMFRLRDTISRVVMSGCQGYGAAMVGYRPIYATALPKDSDDEDIAIGPDGSLDLSAFQLNPLTGLPVLDDAGKPIKKADLPVWEEWFIDWVHYRSIIIDPDGGNDFMRHRWVAVEEIRTLEEVKADKLYTNTDDLEATGGLLQDKQDSLRRRVDGNSGLSTLDRDDVKTVRLFRVFDLVKNRMIVLADGHGKMLRDVEMPRGVAHSPLCFFRPNEVIGETEEFFPRPILSELIPLAAEKNYLRFLALAAAKKNIRKVIVDSGVFKPEEEEKFMSDVDMEVVHMDKKGQYGPDKAAWVMTASPVGMDVWNTLRANDADFDEIAGQGSESRGRTTSDTATAVGKRSQYEVTRYDFDRETLADFLQECFKKLDDSIQANMTQPRAVELIGDDGQAFMALVDREMIECDCDVGVDVTEMAPTDDSQQAAQMIQLAQVLGQNRWMATNEAVLRTMCERVRIKDENFISGVMQAAQESLQMEQAAMMAKSQPKVPNAPPPTSEAQAIQQTGGGMQVPNMQGAA